MNRPIILASTSPFRKAILEKLAIPFTCCAPNVDEQAKQGESPHELVARLAKAKAAAVCQQYQQGLVIGSDQVAVIDDQILGKPHHHVAAVVQLQQSSGKIVRFLTGLCLMDVATGQSETLVETFDVHFKVLSLETINHYLRLEEPYQCAGSFKSEAAGIALFQRLAGAART